MLSCLECSPTTVHWRNYTVALHDSTWQKSEKWEVRSEKCVISFYLDLRTSSWNSEWRSSTGRFDFLIFSCWLVCVCSACVVCVFCGRDTRSVSGWKKIPRGPKGRFWAAAGARRGSRGNGAAQQIGQRAQDRAQQRAPACFPASLPMKKNLKWNSMEVFLRLSERKKLRIPLCLIQILS